MDGRLLVLCEEDVTINSYNQRVDKDGDLVRKKKTGSYEDKNLETIQVDENKDVISAIDLIMPIETQSIQNRDILYVDWETVMPQNIEYLKELIEYSKTTIPLSPQLLHKGLKQKDSIMKRAHEESFYAIQDERPSFDYRFIAMEKFTRTLYNMMDKNGIVAVLPTYRKDSSTEIKHARQRMIQSFAYKNATLSQAKKKSKINILQPIEYEEFGQIFKRAQDEMMKIYSAPDWYDAPSDGSEIGE